jgi:hypothetical protein
VKRHNVSAELRRLHPPRSVLWVRRHICTGTGLTPATSAPGLGSPLPHLHRDWARRCHICTETGLAAAAFAPGLGPRVPHLDTTLPPLHQDWAHARHICAGTGLTPCHFWTETGPAAATCAAGWAHPLPHLHRFVHRSMIRSAQTTLCSPRAPRERMAQCRLLVACCRRGLAAGRRAGSLWLENEGGLRR